MLNISMNMKSPPKVCQVHAKETGGDIILSVKKCWQIKRQSVVKREVKAHNFDLTRQKSLFLFSTFKCSRVSVNEKLYF